MRFTLTSAARYRIFRWKIPRMFRPSLSLIALLIVFPALAFGQSPFDTGFTALQTVFTGTVAKVASLIAIVVGGYQFAHGEPGAKKSAEYAAKALDRRMDGQFRCSYPSAARARSRSRYAYRPISTSNSPELDLPIGSSRTVIQSARADPSCAIVLLKWQSKTAWSNYAAK